MVAHQWTELGPRVWLQGPRVPELESDCWWVRLNSDTAGCGVEGILKLMWPCWWQGLSLLPHHMVLNVCRGLGTESEEGTPAQVVLTPKGRAGAVAPE